jgi:outer membrane protein assembly factor BamB
MNKCRLFLTACFLVVCGVCQADASDWYGWRGPWQTGASPEKDLPSSWSPDPKAKDNNLVWKAPYGSRSTPLVMGGRVYLINYSSENGKPETIQERVMCLDEKTGKFMWEYNFNVWHTDIVTSRLGWTNLAGDPATGNVYAHGTQGLFFCFDKDGKVLWSRSLTEEYGRVSGYGGRVNSPIVAEDLVIIGMLNSAWGDYAKGANRFLAMNKLTGEVVWWSDPAGQVKGTYYSVPVVATINGQAMLITGSSDGGVYGLKLRTGEKVWGYIFGSLAINCSPVVEGNLVYIGHGEESPDNNIKGRIICVDASKIVKGAPELVWQKDGVKVRYCSPIVNAGRLYIADEIGKLYCFDAKDGKPIWKKGYHYSRGSQGSPVLADGKIYVSETASKFYILEPDDKECKTLHVQEFPGGEEMSGNPAVANGRVFFTTSDEIFCIGKPGARSAAEPPVYWGPKKALDKIAALQILPADVAVHPGATVTFKVRGFDENGNFVKDLKPEECGWKLPTPPLPPGAKTPPPPLDGEVIFGKLTVGTKKPSQQGYVTASFGELTARSRVRVVGVLPYAPNFNNIAEGAAPGGWVNTQGKYVIKTMKDGKKVLAKVNTNPNPLVARGNAYIGLPTMKDYTMQCDILGTKVVRVNEQGNKEEWSPEMGIGANRYTMLMAGGIQKLRIVSWDVLPRIDNTIPFSWKADTWYTFKMTVEVKGPKDAIVKGKVWERGQPEPTEWTITVSDSRPNTEGSPTIYGFVQGATDVAPGTDILYDNVRISANKK